LEQLLRILCKKTLSTQYNDFQKISNKCYEHVLHKNIVPAHALRRKLQIKLKLYIFKLRKTFIKEISEIFNIRYEIYV